VARWPGITAGPHRFGGTEFRLGRGEIGHVHPGGFVDVPFPRAVRDEIVAAGVARPHHTLPESGWVSFRMVAAPDADHAIALLRRSYTLRTEHDGGRGKSGTVAEPGASVHDAVDESVDESFPASDPPAVGSREPDPPR
jgi:hypothetical protein